jgi:hypothetical protein
MIGADNAGTLERGFEIERVPFGRVRDISFREQVRFEGWILGVG